MFATRLITAAILLPLFVGALFGLSNFHWALVLVPLLLVASREWARLAGYARIGRWLFPGIVALSAASLLFAIRPPRFPLDGIIYGASAAFWLLLAPVWLRHQWRVSNPLLLAVVGWVVLVPAWLALVQLQTAPLQLLILMGIVWIADSAAYMAGKRFGKHKLASAISPGKTWEGVTGAAVAVAVYYVGVRLFLEPATAWMGGVVGCFLWAMMTVMSIEGDLFESWMKRQAGVKDSGNLLPGHGGVLDRIDGLTASMPVAALFFSYLQ
ncbi:MAG: phosphatidate cytidylyltransferase [Burkholderiales bacterium]